MEEELTSELTTASLASCDDTPVSKATPTTSEKALQPMEELTEEVSKPNGDDGMEHDNKLNLDNHIENNVDSDNVLRQCVKSQKSDIVDPQSPSSANAALLDKESQPADDVEKFNEDNQVNSENNTDVNAERLDSQEDRSQDEEDNDKNEDNDTDKISETQELEAEHKNDSQDAADSIQVNETQQNFKLKENSSVDREIENNDNSENNENVVNDVSKDAESQQSDNINVGEIQVNDGINVGENQPNESEMQEDHPKDCSKIVESKTPDDSQDNFSQLDDSKIKEIQSNDSSKVEENKALDDSQEIDSQLDESPSKEKDSLTTEINLLNTMKDEDDIQNPTFENAPELAEQSTEDHSQALDPFDELLKGADERTTEKSKDTSDTALNTSDGMLDDDSFADDHNADDNIAGIDADDDVPHDDAPPDVEEVGEPGEDEEVCLLPDTEREISEADREKAIEASKLLSTGDRKDDDPDKASHTEDSAAATTEEADATDTVEDGDPVLDAAEDVAEDAAHEDLGTAEDKDKDGANVSSFPSSIIQEIGPVDNPCIECSEDKPCTYKLVRDGNIQYICGEACVKTFKEKNPNYTVNEKKYLIVEILPTQLTCSECEEEKVCYFYYNSDGEDTNYCSLACLHSMMADEQHKYVFKRKRLIVNETDPVDETCYVCEGTKCSFQFMLYGEKKFVCSSQCIKKMNEKESGRFRVKKKPKTIKVANIPLLKKPLLKLKVISNATDKYLDEGYKIQAKTPAAAAAAREDRERSFIRRCVQCVQTISGDEKNLSWETMDFCNETCLQRYQNVIGSKCANCKNAVNHTSLGKYCVRFGYDIRQFCCSTCLEEFKKGLKICCYCQRDISSGFEGFLAPVGDKGQFKDFCSKQCMAKFEQMSKNPVPQPVWAKCAVCSVEKPTQIEVGIDDDHSQRLCSDPCFAAFKFVNSICPDQCRWCKKYFERKSERCFTIYTEQSTHCFCTRACMNVYISNSRHIVPCNWCKVKKYNFDMIRRTLANGQNIMMCSLNCLNLYQVSVNAISSRRIKCDMCKRTSQAQYHLTMSDATVRNFCTYQCVMSFQAQYTKHGQPLVVGEPSEPSKAVPTGAPRRTYPSPRGGGQKQQQQQQQQTQTQTRSNLPVISNVQSLATPVLSVKPNLVSVPSKQPTTRGKSKRLQQVQAPPPEPELPRVITPPPPPKPLTPPPPPPPKIYNHVLVKTLPPVEVANKATMTKPMTVTKGVSCRPHPCTKECQTDSSLERRVLIPVPVPIYVPVPIAMYSLPFPIPVPIPIPIPTPVFIPTTRNSAKGIMKEITKIHDKMPTDPFEAELLMMAEMVAGDKKKSESDSETDDENDEGFSPDAIDGGNAFGEDMLQMALKMASEYEEPPVDLESAMTASTITPSSHPGMPGLEGEAAMHHHHQMMVLEQQRALAGLRASQQTPPARGKRAPATPAPSTRAARSKRRRQEPAPPPPEPAREPVEKPDANMCLKYTFGVNAWKQWVMTKNAEIEKSSVRRKPFKSEILQLTADELNYSLCLFVKEVRKPNGSEYAPDTIYYLVLGIQQYLFENGRIDNIFTDPYYEKFTECLDEVARKFSVLYNDSQYIVTRVEEEHLWESKQLGAHSPHVLLSTLMFFNTKHFNLVTVEEHMQLSFSHIMKHWKRSPNQAGAGKMPGSRNVLLRFYPPQSALEANSRKKKVYEQQENEENPLRCPVKLYEFYISKCPESVRTRNDVFYLLPERSCVPDSPVWYSTQALGQPALAKMLHRVKMVKEINIALLTS